MGRPKAFDKLRNISNCVRTLGRSVSGPHGRRYERESKKEVPLDLRTGSWIAQKQVGLGKMKMDGKERLREGVSQKLTQCTHLA